MVSAIQFASNDKFTRKQTVQGSKDYKTQSLTTQIKREEKVVGMLPATKEGCSIIKDGFLELKFEIKRFRYSDENKIKCWK